MTADRGRILILNERDPRNPRSGGAEAHVWEIFGRFAERGYEVSALAASFRGSASRERVDGIDVHRLGPPGPSYLRAAARVVSGTRRGRVDLLVECLNKLPFYAPLFSRKPVLAICHHLFGEAAFEQVSWPVAATVWLAERPIPWVHRRSAFLAISESSREDLVRRGVARDQTRVIPCGIRRPKVANPAPASTRRPLVSYVGRLEAYKRVDVVLRAVAALRPRFPEIEVVIVGTGTARPALEALASELGLGESVRFAGFVSDEERDALLAESRVCVCASVKEGWGLTVIEANAVGTPPRTHRRRSGLHRAHRQAPGRRGPGRSHGPRGRSVVPAVRLG